MYEELHRLAERSTETFGELSRVAHVEGLIQNPFIFLNLVLAWKSIGMPN